MNEPLAYLKGEYVPASQCVLPVYDLGIVLGAAVTDFMHVVGYLYAATMAIAQTLRAGWPVFLERAEACWQGRVDEVIAQLQAWQQQHPLPPDRKWKDVDDKDARKIVHQTVTYLTNNRHRMKYPEYRKKGLPVTSSLIESLIKDYLKKQSRDK